MKVGISKEARNDLATIARIGKRSFGTAQAKAYERKLRNSFALIGLYPELAHIRKEAARPIRIHPCGAHLIIYSWTAKRSASSGFCTPARIGKTTSDGLPRDSSPRQVSDLAGGVALG